MSEEVNGVRFCPECGCELYKTSGWNKEFECANCGQSYFDDVDYSSVIARNMRKLSKPTTDNTQTLYNAIARNEQLEEDYSFALQRESELITKVSALEARLEIGYAFDVDGNRIKADVPDGIACRDETINQLEAANAKLSAQAEHALKRASEIIAGYDNADADKDKRIAQLSAQVVVMRESLGICKERSGREMDYGSNDAAYQVIFEESTNALTSTTAECVESDRKKHKAILQLIEAARLSLLEHKDGIMFATVRESLEDALAAARDCGLVKE